MAPSFTAADYQSALLAMLPPGIIWPRDPASVVGQVLGMLAPTFARLNERAAHLLVDAAPTEPVELLPEWELTLGLPDPCTGDLPTIQQRQQAVLAKFLADGGQTVAYFVAVARALGVVISITEYTPTSCAGRMRAGDALHGDAWAHHWLVSILGQQAVLYFRAGQSSAGDPLQSYGVSSIQCVINRLKPAHTTVSYEYVTLLLLSTDTENLLASGSSLLSVQYSS